MRYQPLKADLFARHRTRFTASLKPNSVAFFNSSDIYPTSADGSFPFKQATDILWLSGIDQEESILVLFPDAPKPVLVGAGAAMGILGEQVLELAVRRLISFKLGGDPK